MSDVSVLSPEDRREASEVPYLLSQHIGRCIEGADLGDVAAGLPEPLYSDRLPLSLRIRGRTHQGKVVRVISVHI